MDGGRPVIARWVVGLLLTFLMSGCLRDEIFPEPYAWKEGPSFENSNDWTRQFFVPAEARRLRFDFGVEFGQDVPILGEQAGVELRLRDGDGDVFRYNATRSMEFGDTFGGTIEGTWTVSVSDPGGGTRTKIAFDVFLPKYDDWAWWQVWNQ